MTDNLIIKIIYSKSKPSTHYIRNKDKYPNITNYIINRYKDSKTFRESLDRMKFGIEERPVCKYCNKETVYRCLGNYAPYCSRKCANNANLERRKETCLLKYGVDNPAKSERVKEKGRQTCLNKYYTHNTHPYNPNSVLDQVLVERYKERYGPKCQAITIWTIKDPEKRNCAKHNHLNFKEIWSLEEGKKFIDFLYSKYHKQ